MRYYSACLVLMLGAMCSLTGIAQHRYLSVPFDTTKIPPPPDYSNIKYWAAHPIQHDLADSTPSNLVEAQQNAEADVFYVYPTTYTDKPDDRYLWNADVNNVKLNLKTTRSAILYQASIFNATCRVYAPFYRQAHYDVFLTHDSLSRKKALDLAYQDVKAAFEYYLAHDNWHRPIVIAAHSQGTVHATRLLQEFFMNKPLQRQLVVAYLPGMPVIPDSLPGLSPCRDSLQTGCYTCWNTFKKQYIPNYYPLGLVHSVCTNPLSWTLDETYRPAQLNRGAVVRPFGTIRPGCCDAKVHAGLLWTSRPDFPGSFLLRTPIYHVGDYNLFYINIRDNVAVRLKAWQEAQQH